MNNKYAEDAKGILDSATQKVPADAIEVDIQITWKLLDTDVDWEYFPDVTVKWKRANG